MIIIKTAYCVSYMKYKLICRNIKTKLRRLLYIQRCVTESQRCIVRIKRCTQQCTHSAWTVKHN